MQGIPQLRVKALLREWILDLGFNRCLDNAIAGAADGLRYIDGIPIRSHCFLNVVDLSWAIEGCR